VSVLSSELAPPAPLSRKQVCPPPLGTKGGRGLPIWTTGENAQDSVCSMSTANSHNVRVFDKSIYYLIFEVYTLTPSQGDDGFDTGYMIIFQK
jgi:hypothetical protein